MNPSIDTLAEDIAQHDFVSAVRKVVSQYPNKPGLGEATHLKDEYLRLSQKVRLSFSGVSLDRLEACSGTKAHEYRLFCNFQGLFGSNGGLPLHYTEYAVQRSAHQHDDTFAEFIDVFNHRLLSLFYRASTQFDPSINHDRPENNEFSLFLGALSGFGIPETHALNIPEKFRLRHTGWFGSKTKSPDGLISLIRDYFDLPARIEEFRGRWLDLPEDATLSLGSQREGSQLGKTSWLGRRVWNIGQGFTLQLGPLQPADFRSFQPGSQRSKDLHELVRLYTGDEYDWDLELLVEDHKISGLRLDRKTTLGFDSWLQSSSRTVSQQDGIRLNHKMLTVAA